jgi:hypothetical protein
LAKLLLFNRLDTQIQRKLVAEMFERNVNAGEILIKEGDTGLAATELYVVKSGKFEVSCTVKQCSSGAGESSFAVRVDLRRFLCLGLATCPHDQQTLVPIVPIGAATASGPEYACEHQGAWGLLRRDFPYVR